MNGWLVAFLILMVLSFIAGGPLAVIINGIILLVLFYAIYGVVAIIRRVKHRNT